MFVFRGVVDASFACFWFCLGISQMNGDQLFFFGYLLYVGYSYTQLYRDENELFQGSRHELIIISWNVRRGLFALTFLTPRSFKQTKSSIFPSSNSLQNIDGGKMKNQTFIITELAVWPSTTRSESRNFWMSRGSLIDLQLATGIHLLGFKIAIGEPNSGTKKQQNLGVKHLIYGKCAHFLLQSIQ